MLMIVRREGKKLRRYVHLGTGNYHQANTRLYTDYGLLTNNKEITHDVHEIFLQLTTQSANPELSQLNQSPYGISDMFIANLDKEIENAKQGKPAKVIAKVNGLSSPDIIKKMYEASQAGVQIDLIVRGICCLRPGLEGVSENISVRSIVGRFLEHDRIFYFENNGDQSVYISSADLMPRNLQNRIEQCAPILNKDLKLRIINNLDSYLKDNTSAWLMQPDGEYILSIPSDLDENGNLNEINAQQTLLENLSESF